MNILPGPPTLILRLKEIRGSSIRLLIVSCISVLLCACGVTRPMIKSEAISFDDVIEDTTDKLLVLNILRARDQAPLHFAKIPAINETIQQNSSLSIANIFGIPNGTSHQNNATAQASLQISPSFSVNLVDSKEFVTGMASPIQPKFVKYWLDRGLDSRIILLLFFSSAEISGKVEGKNIKIKISNTPRESADDIVKREEKNSEQNNEPPASCKTQNNCANISQFELYLHLINRFKQFDVELSPPKLNVIGGPFGYKPDDTSDLLKTIAALESSKFKINFIKGDYKYYLCQSSGDPQLNFTHINGTKLEIGNKDSSNECDSNYVQNKGALINNGNSESSDTVSLQDLQNENNEIKENNKKFYLLYREYENELAPSANDKTNGTNVTIQPKVSINSVTLQIRSVGEMIHYLGDLLYYQNVLSEQPKTYLSNAGLNIPVTLGYCPTSGDDRNNEGCSDILFNLSDNAPDQARFKLMYRGVSYAVSNFDALQKPFSHDSHTRTDFNTRKDHTLEILAVLRQLVDLNQSATDIRETPFVKVLP